MKDIFLTLLCLIILNVHSQLPYSWTTGVNPGWTSVNSGSGGALNWNAGCLGGVVTTNCTGSYTNNQNTSYISPIIDASCTNASTISLSFNISGEAEYGFDFLFCEYSIDGGTTWINFYGPGVGLTGNAGAFPGVLWTLPVIPTSSNFRFRFRFTSDFLFRDEGYKLTNFQIICNVALSIDLLSFTGENIDNENILNWVTSSEVNNSHFRIEHSFDGDKWEILSTISGNNSPSMYKYIHSNPRNVINYYRLIQVDFDGIENHKGVISIDNRKKESEIIGIYNILGQNVTMEFTGLKIIRYSDGTTKKVY